MDEWMAGFFRTGAEPFLMPLLVLMRGSIYRGSTCLGMHKGLAGMCRDTWGTALLLRLRAAGMGKTKAAISKE